MLLTPRGHPGHQRRHTFARMPGAGDPRFLWGSCIYPPRRLSRRFPLTRRDFSLVATPQERAGANEGTRDNISSNVSVSHLVALVIASLWLATQWMPAVLGHKQASVSPGW